MRYWWVNQNQTYRQEVAGGYLWSPQRKTNNARNPFYESMREVSPGDIVFSFAESRLKAIGVAQSYCYECPKPAEFGSAGMYWDNVGWRVDVRFTEEPLAVRPKDHIEQLRPLLPARYSPLNVNGDGSQSVYLTELPTALAVGLATLMGRPVLDLVQGNALREVSVEAALSLPKPAKQWEDVLVGRIQSDPAIAETEREALILARLGQGAFRRNVSRIESSCRVTRVDRPEHLRASHCKPWRDCSNDQRLDSENGLMLTPSIDHLFDRGFIAFDGAGSLLISPVAHGPSLAKMGVPVDRLLTVGRFTEGQKVYLEYHLEHVFLSRRVGP